MPQNLPPAAKVNQADAVFLVDPTTGLPAPGGGSTTPMYVLTQGTGSADAPITTGLATGGASTGAGTAPVSGGTYLWWVDSGTFNGATLQLQGSPTGTNYLPIVGAVLTAVGVWEVDLSANEQVRVLITGGPPSGLTTYLQKVS